MNLDSRVTYEHFLRRLLAGLIDLFLLLLLAAAVALVGIVAGAEVPEAPLIAEYHAMLAWIPTWLVIAWVALVPLWAFLGATPGMLLIGSRVVAAASGRRLTLVQSAARAVGLALGLAALGIGVVWCIWDARRQGLHDKLARSVVVREDESLMTLEELVEGFE